MAMGATMWQPVQCSITRSLAGSSGNSLFRSNLPEAWELPEVDGAAVGATAAGGLVGTADGGTAAAAGLVGVAVAGAAVGAVVGGTAVGAAGALVETAGTGVRLGEAPPPPRRLIYMSGIRRPAGAVPNFGAPH